MTPLDAEELADALRVPVIVHETVDSTMTAAEMDGRAPVVHVAERQAAGQGRHGRRWESPPGNLYATVAWPEPPTIPAGLLGAIQVAWAEAVAATGGPRTLCKWPNDGIVGEGKWAGLLARRVGDARLLVGLGANLESAPELEDLLAVPPAALVDHWQPWPGRDAVSGLLLEAAVTVLREGAAGIDDRLARWHLHDAFEPGAPLAIDGAPALIGRYAGIAPDGRLRLATDAGEVLVAAGDARRVRGLS